MWLTLGGRGDAIPGINIQGAMQNASAIHGKVIVVYAAASGQKPC